MSDLDLEGKKALIVDDIPEMRSIMRTMLSELGCYDIVLAKDGTEAIDEMLLQKFDIILCDYNLGPGKDGQQVMEEAMHRDIMYSSTVFIMVTAENKAQMVMGAIEMAPDAYLNKPLNKKVLHTRLQSLLEKKQAMKPIYDAVDRQDYNVALEICDKVLEKKPKNRNELLKIKSQILLSLGKYDEVEHLCSTLIAEREIVWAMFDLARVYYYREEYEDALVVFTRVVKLNSGFITAYDWLARAQQKVGNLNGAQRTLEDAVDLSPKSLMRQRALAEIAEENHDFSTAERARKRAVSVGKGSILRESSDYSSLAKTQIKNNATQEAMKTVGTMETEFEDDLQAKIEASVTLCSIYEAAGDKKSSRETLDKSLRLAKKYPQYVTADVGIELAENCIANDRQEDADRMIEEVIKNNHENEQVLKKVANVYNKEVNSDKGEELIKDIKEKIIKINNDGVELIRQGKLEEAIELFTHATKGMPRNAIVNLNAAQSIIMYMKQHKPTRTDIARAMKHIDMAGRSEKHQLWINKLRSECQKLISRL